MPEQSASLVRMKKVLLRTSREVDVSYPDFNKDRRGKKICKDVKLTLLDIRNLICSENNMENFCSAYL